MSKFNNKNFNSLNSGPQHPAAHGVLLTVIFTKKNITKRGFSSTNNLAIINNLNGEKKSKISKAHINEFLTIIDSFKKNPRQSRLINSCEIIDYFNSSKRGYIQIPIAFGIWFQNSETNVWSILEFEEITGNFQNPQNGVFLGLMTFKIKDISDLPAYNFLYNNKTYQMDGTIGYDSMNEIINKVDSNLVLKFLENVSKKTNNLITDFDKFITIVILSNHIIKTPNGNPSRLCGIVLPALFSNNARYQIYTAPTIYIRPYKDKNDLENSISKLFFQIPAPVSEKTRVPYYDDCPGDEINLDGSIPFEAIDIKFFWNPKFQQNFDFMKSLAKIQKITHTNLDWIIFMLLSESRLNFSDFSEIQNLEELSSEDISNSIGYHLPVYYCLTDYNEFFKKGQLQYLENKKDTEEMLFRIKNRKESESQCLKTENSHLSLWERIQLNKKNNNSKNNKKLSNSLVSKRFMFSVPELAEISQQISRREPMIIRVWMSALGSKNPRPIIFNSDGGFITKNLPIQPNKKSGLVLNSENQSILESLQTVITLDNSINNIKNFNSWKVGNDRVVFPISGISIQEIIQSSFESSKYILNDLIEEAVSQNSTVVIDVFNNGNNVKITKLQTPHFFAELSKGVYTSNEEAIQSLGENFVIVNTLIQDSGIINCNEWPNYARGVEIQTISEIETIREAQMMHASDRFSLIFESNIIENPELELLISKHWK